jgi:hypothetical protein
MPADDFLLIENRAAVIALPLRSAFDPFNPGSSGSPRNRPLRNISTNALFPGLTTS